LGTHSFFSHHLGDTLLPLFILYSRHTTSSLHGDTRRLIRHTDCCSLFPIRHTDPSRHTGNSSYQIVSATHASSATHAGIGNTCRNLFFFFYSLAARPTDPSSHWRHTPNSFTWNGPRSLTHDPAHGSFTPFVIRYPIRSDTRIVFFFLPATHASLDTRVLLHCRHTASRSLVNSAHSQSTSSIIDPHRSRSLTE